MAEFVHRRTERMLPELEQMQRIGLFTSKEIQAIIKKRTAHEYKLVRRVKAKEDFLAYIQYDVHVLDLITKRRKMENYYFKKDEIEYVIVSRIHSLFKQLTMRWANDLKLWFLHAQFCLKWKKRTQLAKLCSKFLQIHGNRPKHWVLAAKWQFECDDSSDNIRSIFLQACKKFPEDQNVWLEFFRAELLFTEKLTQRMMLLEGGKLTKSDDSVGESEDLLLSGEAAKIVYKNALQAIPDNPLFHVEFLQIANLFVANKFASKVTDCLKQDLIGLYPATPKVVSVLAKISLETGEEPLSSERLEYCCAQFSDALKTNNSEDMWGEYFDCLYNILFNGNVQNETMIKLVEDAFFQVAYQAHKQSMLTEERHLKYIDAFVSCGQLTKGYQIASELTKKSSNVKLIAKRTELGILLLQVQPSLVNVEELLNQFLSLQSLNDEKCASHLFLLWMQLAVLSENENMEKRIYDTALKKLDRDLTIDMQKLYLTVLINRNGVEDTLEKMLFGSTGLQPPTLKQYQCMLELIEHHHPVKAAKRVFEMALGDHGSEDPDLWIQYIKFKKSLGGKDAIDIGTVHWRALKNLQPELVQEFVTLHALLAL